MVSETGGGAAEMVRTWRFVLGVEFVIGYGWTGGIFELWPTSDVGEGCGENVWVGGVRRAEGYDATAIWVVDIA